MVLSLPTVLFSWGKQFPGECDHPSRLSWEEVRVWSESVDISNKSHMGTLASVPRTLQQCSSSWWQALTVAFVHRPHSQVICRCYLVVIGPVRADLYSHTHIPTVTSQQSEGGFLCLKGPNTCIFQSASILTTQVIRINSSPCVLRCLSCNLTNISFEMRVSIECVTFKLCNY